MKRVEQASFFAIRAPALHAALFELNATPMSFAEGNLAQCTIHLCTEGACRAGARMQLHNFFFTSLMPIHLHTFHYLYTFAPEVHCDCDACTEGAKKKCNGVEKLPDAPKDWRSSQMVWRYGVIGEASRCTKRLAKLSNGVEVWGVSGVSGVSHNARYTVGSETCGGAKVHELETSKGCKDRCMCTV